MGVAGIDVPLSQILKFIPHHKLGVNAYFFMVTNNGLVIFHPDLRPRVYADSILYYFIVIMDVHKLPSFCVIFQFNGILRPGYNSIDMAELEQEDLALPRNMSKSMLEVSKTLIIYYFKFTILAIADNEMMNIFV